jgi:hypothetical protein
MIEIKMSFECLRDAEGYLSVSKKALQANEAAHDFYYMLKNKIKHEEHSETEMKLLEDVMARFCRSFQEFLP